MKNKIIWIIALFLLVVPVYANDDELVIVKTGDSELYLSETGDHELNEIWDFETEETTVSDSNKKSVHEEPVPEIAEPEISAEIEKKPAAPPKEISKPAKKVLVLIKEKIPEISKAVSKLTIPFLILAMIVIITLIIISVTKSRQKTEIALPTINLMDEFDVKTTMSIVNKVKIAMTKDKQLATHIYNNAVRAYYSLSDEKKRIVYDELNDLKEKLSN